MGLEAFGLSHSEEINFYVLIEFKAEPTVIKKLEVAYRRDERVIRDLTTKLDKYAIQYAEKRRNRKNQKEA